MRRRLRPAHSPEDLARIYAEPHDSERWADHRDRVDHTVRWIRDEVGPVRRAADLSCGNGKILTQTTADEKIFGDIAPGWPIVGPIEDTLPTLEHVDLLIMSETLEHLDDPDAVLAEARRACDILVLSTPTLEWETRGGENREHYWSWSLDDVRAMLHEARFDDLVCRVLRLGYYDYQLWIAR